MSVLSHVAVVPGLSSPSPTMAKEQAPSPAERCLHLGSAPVSQLQFRSLLPADTPLDGSGDGSGGGPRLGSSPWVQPSLAPAVAGMHWGCEPEVGVLPPFLSQVDKQAKHISGAWYGASAAEHTFLPPLQGLLACSFSAL